ncbi:hypothetical protein [Streptomyces sp. SA3_actF]|uniref:hypothetical protein n=1 Tax=Streptomyces sp. SA3_actF TaxID=682181 RepID=UPI000308C615|nr:hypothetical protein [Streptomyces sp. SA3_actF]
MAARVAQEEAWDEAAGLGEGDEAVGADRVAADQAPRAQFAGAGSGAYGVQGRVEKGGEAEPQRGARDVERAPYPVDEQREREEEPGAEQGRAQVVAPAAVRRPARGRGPRAGEGPPTLYGPPAPYGPPGPRAPVSPVLPVPPSSSRAPLPVPRRSVGPARGGLPVL